MAKREISDHLRERVCALVEEWALAGESNAEIARSLGVERPTVGAIRNEGVAGLRVAMAVAKRLGVSLEQLEQDATRLAPKHALGRPPRHPQRADSTRPVLGNLPGFHTAMLEAKKREPFFPPFAWDDATATSPLIVPPHVDAEMLIFAARLAISLRNASELEAAESTRIDDEERAREARQVEGERRVREAEARGERLSLTKAMAQLRREQTERELADARAKDAARAPAANDAPPRAANEVAKKPRATKAKGKRS